MPACFMISISSPLNDLFFMEWDCNRDIKIRMAISMMAAPNLIQYKSFLFKSSGKLLW